MNIERLDFEFSLMSDFAAAPCPFCLCYSVTFSVTMQDTNTTPAD